MNFKHNFPDILASLVSTTATGTENVTNACVKFMLIWHEVIWYQKFNLPLLFSECYYVWFLIVKPLKPNVVIVEELPLQLTIALKFLANNVMLVLHD